MSKKKAKKKEVKTESRNVQINEWYQVHARIEGLVALMNDRFNPEILELPKVKKDKEAWKRELPLKIWKDKNGVYIPTDNIRMMLIGNTHRVGAANILGKYIETKKGAEYMSFVNSCVWITGIKDSLKCYIQPHRTAYDDYDERTFITSTGARGITRRPIFNTPWAFEFIVQVTDVNYSPEKVKEFFDVAGLRCGLGAYGPTFGRFIVTKWDVVESLDIKPTKRTRAVKVPKNHIRAKSHGKNNKKKTS